MIIVEGPDGAGKTTLAEAIAADFRLEYRRNPKVSSTEGPEGPSAYEWFIAELLAGYRHVREGVYDRIFPISELVYRSVMETTSSVSPSQMTYAQSLLAATDSLIIFCLPADELVYANLKKGKSKQLKGLTRAKAEQLVWTYHTVAHLWGLTRGTRVVMYDWDNRAFIMERVQEYLKKERP